jgi:SAM-dependent methyltransferase
MEIDWGTGHYESTGERLLPAAHEVVALAGVGPGMRVLDVGCGTGNAALLAAERAAHVTAVDPAPRLLEVARSRAAAAGLDLELLQGEAARLPVPDGGYDVVLSVFAAIFAPDARAALADMARVLAPGGRVVMSAWVPGGAISAMNRVAGEAVAEVLGTPPGPPGFPWHEPPAVTALASDLGLNAEAQERTIAFTAASPEAYVEAEQDHPMALAARQVLAQHGVDEVAFRARLAVALRAENEDPSAFRATSRYLVWSFSREG